MKERFEVPFCEIVYLKKDVIVTSIGCDPEFPEDNDCTGDGYTICTCTLNYDIPGSDCIPRPES